ncbi:MAG: hypothetical protein WCP79_09000 [Bacillota bacterium]
MKQLLIGFVQECIQAQTSLSLQSGKIILPLTPSMREKLQAKLAGKPIKAIEFIADGFDVIVSKSIPVIGEVDFRIKFRAFAIQRDGGVVKIHFRLDSYKIVKYLLPLLTNKLEDNNLAISIESNCWTIDISRKVAGIFEKSWGEAEELKVYVEKMFFSTAISVTLRDNNLIIMPKLKLNACQKQILLDFIESTTA